VYFAHPFGKGQQPRWLYNLRSTKSNIYVLLVTCRTVGFPGMG